MSNFPMGSENDPILDWMKYNKKTGLLTWKKLIVGRGNNKIKIGYTVGSLNNKGYINVNFQGRQLKAHRIAWFFENGSWPKNQIDHKNGIKSDNRISNLRDCSNQENHQNRKTHRGGRLVGTYFCKLTNLWVSQIRKNGKKIHLGRFKTELEANKKYMQELKK